MDTSFVLLPEGTILSMDVLSRSNMVVSLKESKIKVFNLETSSVAFTIPLPGDKPSSKVIKVDHNTFAAACK